MSHWRKIPVTLRHLLLVTILGVPLVMPLLRWAYVPCTHDGHLHIHRIAAMRYAWGNGLYFSRWLPDLALGYGYPFFVYREPAPLYAILGPHLMGIPLPAATNIFYILCILASGWFMFLWVNDIAGPRAGIVSSVAYMSAPYIMLDALVRGNAPESLALPLFPLLLWIGRRWMTQGSVAAFLVSVFSLAFLSLSHNISIFLFTPVLILYLLAVGWLKKLAWNKVLMRLLLFIVLGLGMTFFYTGGALLEMDEVTLSQSTTTRNNDFHYNFASWSEILAPVAMENPDLLNPPLPIRLGWVPTVLAMLGLTSIFWKRGISREQHWHVLWMGAAVLLFLFMALPLSLPLWEGLPLIDFVQFPWRFIGRAALPVAFLAGAPFAQTMNIRGTFAEGWKKYLSQLSLLAAVALLLIESLPNLFPRYCQEIPFPTIVDVHNYEQATGLIGVDPEGSYFPRTVQKRPASSPLTADYQNETTPQRFDLSAMPDGASAAADYSRLRARIEIDSPAPFMARYLTFAFPGWRVTVDGAESSIVASDPEGLITFYVPEGRHIINIHWQSTLLRTALSLVSILAFVGVIVTAVLLAKRKKPDKTGKQKENEALPEYWPLLVLGLAILLFKITAVDRELTPLKRAGPAYVQNSIILQAQGQRIDGYNLTEKTVTSGETFDIDLAWSTVESSNNSYQSNIWLAGPDGLLWSDKETQRPRIFEDAPPTWERAAGSWTWDSREVQVLPGTPPGAYDLVLTLFDLDTLQPLTLIGENGVVVGPTAVIGQVTVQLPDVPGPVNPQHNRQDSVPGTGLQLRGYNQDHETAGPGDTLLLTLFWEPENGPIAQTFDLRLLDEDGQAAQSWRLPLFSRDLSAQWPAGQILRGQYPLRLPAGLAGGTYQFVLQDDLPLGSLVVETPERIFDQPDFAVPVHKVFNEQASLAGYTVLNDSPLTIEIVWQALVEMDTGYHVFVHVLNDAGELIAQSDKQPANWTRPTTGWVPGEYIIDVHELNLPAEQTLDGLHFQVGLYDPSTKERLPVGAENFVSLPITGEDLGSQ